MLIIGGEEVEEVFAEDYDEPVKSDPVPLEISSHLPHIEEEEKDDFTTEV